MTLMLSPTSPLCEQTNGPRSFEQTLIVGILKLQQLEDGMHVGGSSALRSPTGRRSSYPQSTEETPVWVQTADSDGVDGEDLWMWSAGI